jgi:hypothetical protein
MVQDNRDDEFAPVQMVVMDGIVMGHTVCQSNSISIMYQLMSIFLSTVHLMAAWMILPILVGGCFMPCMKLYLATSVAFEIVAIRGLLEHKLASSIKINGATIQLIWEARVCWALPG